VSGGVGRCRAVSGGVGRCRAVPTLLLHPLLILPTMKNQLTLIDRTRADWRLDEKTKELGRKGVAAAREALAEAARRAMEDASRTTAA